MITCLLPCLWLPKKVLLIYVYINCNQHVHTGIKIFSPSSYRYSTAQIKLDRTHVQHGLNTTCLSFYMRASMRVHAGLMISNLSFKALVYALDVCTTVCRCTCACQENTCQFELCVHANCKPRTAE